VTFRCDDDGDDDDDDDTQTDNYAPSQLFSYIEYFNATCFRHMMFSS
jgi:hypothetical protein